MSEPTSPFDLVTVPDFSTPSRAKLFEARTLFFLGSLQEYGGATRHFPVHLACIDTPPASVQRAAEESGAEITVHSPDRRGATLNKLRGLEVSFRTNRVLLLDTDLLVLQDLSSLRSEVPDGIAAAPAGAKWVPEALWKRIYKELRLPLPQERGPVLNIQLGLLPASEVMHYEYGQVTDLKRMLPYHNSGVVSISTDSNLLQTWADHCQHIATLFSLDGAEPVGGQMLTQTKSSWKTRLLAAGRRLYRRRGRWPRSVLQGDQAALATAVEALRAQGVPFHRLPDTFHARRLLFQAGAMRLHEAKVCHLTGFLRPASGEAWDFSQAFAHSKRQWQDSFRSGAARRADEKLREDAEQAGEILELLRRKYVEPVLGSGGR